MFTFKSLKAAAALVSYLDVGDQVEAGGRIGEVVRIGDVKALRMLDGSSVTIKRDFDGRQYTHGRKATGASFRSVVPE